MKIFIIIDAQNDFIDGTLGSAQAQIAVNKICKTLWKETPNANDTAIIFTRDTHYADYLNTAEGHKLPIEHCKINSLGWQINKEIFESASMFKNQKIYNKSTFGSIDLIQELFNLNKTNRIDSITIMGFCTDICVISNALMIKAALPELPLMVKAECCAGVTPEKHKAALEIMNSCQIDIV